MEYGPAGGGDLLLPRRTPREGGGKGIVNGKRALDDLVRATDFRDLDLLPGDFSYRDLDLRLDREKKGVKRLRKRLRPLDADYDLLILDCPPSISLTSEAVFRAADALVVPVIPTTLSLRTLDQLDSFRRDEGWSAPRFRWTPIWGTVPVE